MGRLLEIRAEAGYRDRSEVDAIFKQIAEQSARIPSSQRMVIVTDWRLCNVMAAEAAEQLAAGIRSTNARVERSGALLPLNSSVAMLQFVRILRESTNTERRGFNSPPALIAWLSEVLTPEEIARLEVFIG